MDNSTLHHVLAGSFRSVSLFLLVFSPIHRSLDVVQTLGTFGPHQYLARSARRDRIYTTSWALPPVLSTWSYHADRIAHLNSASITATSSYITVPPPFTHAYSAGGPTGEVHTLDPASGVLADKIQQLLFVPPHELDNADKTRAALRYGAHGIELSPAGSAFVPVLGTNSIEMYTRDPSSGVLAHITSVPSPRGPQAHDGPRHVKVHPNGRILYCVTEHSNFVDAYEITPTGLEHRASRSLLPPPLVHAPAGFRGDTILLAPSTPTHPAPRTLFATTRGASTSVRGWLSAFRLDANGLFVVDTDDDDSAEYWETPTSGGKAHALDVLRKDADTDTDTHTEGVWILLTDDDDNAAGAAGGGVRVLEWDGWGTGGVRHVVAWPHPGEGEVMCGGSHAVWLD